jgi:hypothetical protein
VKSGQLLWENISKWALAIILFVVVALLIYFNKEKLIEMVDKVKLFLKYGG